MTMKNSDIPVWVWWVAGFALAIFLAIGPR